MDTSGTFLVGDVELITETDDLSDEAEAEAERTFATFEAYREQLVAAARRDVLRRRVPARPRVPLLQPGGDLPAHPARAPGAARGGDRHGAVGDAADGDARGDAGDARHPVAARHRGRPLRLVPELTRPTMAKKKTSGGTPATVALDRAGIAFTVHAYDHDATAESYGARGGSRPGPGPPAGLQDAVRGVDTLVVGIVPVSGQLDLKALAAAVGGKKAAMADPADAERASGYVVGGISPIGQRRPHRTVLDTSPWIIRRCTSRAASGASTWRSRPTTWPGSPRRCRPDRPA